MGTDIHLFVEKQNDNGSWSRVAVPPWTCPWCSGDGGFTDRQGKRQQCCWCDGAGASSREYHVRNYDLFAMLAGVRNGRGFAGVDTGDGFVPMHKKLRGLPKDLSRDLQQDKLDLENDEHALWLGNHSFSWCTLEEALAYDYDRTTKHRGIVDSAEYAAWVERGRTGEPESYSGGISGPAVETVSNDEMDLLIANKRVPAKRSPRAHPLDHPKASDGVMYFTQVEWASTYRESAGEAWFNFLEACRSIGDPKRVRFVFGFDS